MEFSIRNVNLQDEIHAKYVIKLLNDYMNDPMGNNSTMPKGMGTQIISGLKKANCNVGFSTFQARPLINIHDFIVAPEFRNQGIGHFLLRAIINYAVDNNFCRVNLEVREDNLSAKSLYKKMGFSDCVPKMMFWERKI